MNLKHSKFIRNLYEQPLYNPEMIMNGLVDCGYISIACKQKR